MSILKILNYKKSAKLRKKAYTVRKIHSDIIEILNDMSDTMHYAGGLGLAAPQVGILKRLVVIDTDSGILGLINPVILKGWGTQYRTERCLSIPGVSGRVKRYKKIYISFINKNGERVKMNASNSLAAVICHEIDHLDGILFIDRM